MIELFKTLFSRDSTMLDTTKMQCAVYGDAYSGEQESIMCDDGELSSTIEVHGNPQPQMLNELVDNIQYISEKLNTFFKTPDRRLIVTYYNEPNDDEYVRDMSAQLDANCETLGLDISDIHRNDLKKIYSLTRTDRLLLTVETGRKSLLEVDYDRAEKEKMLSVDGIFQTLGFSHKYNVKKKMKQYAQNPMHFNGAIYQTHQDTVSSVLNTFTRAGLRCNAIGAKETMRFMHKIFDRYAPLNWEVITTPQSDEEIEADIERQMRIAELTPDRKLFSGATTNYHRVGDGAQARSPDDDLADLLLPPLVTQIVGDDVEILDDGVVSLNGSFYKAMYVEVPQQKLEMFDEFSKTTNDIPFLMNWHLDSNKKMIDRAISRGNMMGMGALLGSQSCKDIKRASDILKGYKKEGVRPMAMYRLSLMTWAPTKEECVRNSNRLRTEVCKWGSEQVVRSEKAMPFQSMLETLPSMTTPQINRSIPCLVEEALFQMPLGRVKSFWDKGTSNFILATDNTIYPVQMGVKQRDFPRGIYVGSAGSGKSLLKNATLLSSMFKKPYHQLPVMAMCTIGYDGELFANTIKSSLPESQHHLVIADKPKLTADYAVNIFDTEYGARFATEFQENTIVGFLEQCFAEPDEVRLSQDYTSILQEVVSKAYHYYSDDSDTAKAYSTGADHEVDAELDALKVSSSERRSRWTWWDAFDYFHDIGNTRLAYRCQLQAMPNISDLIHVMSEYQSVADDARSAKNNNEAIFDQFKRRVVDLQSKFRNLCVATRYNIESARVVILDLESVCPKGSNSDSSETASDRQSAIMYHLYFMFQTRKFLIHKNNKSFLEETKVPKKYHDYHFAIIAAEKGLPKIFDVDEKHRASKAHSFNLELDRVIREMRKYGAEFSGASQNIVDWDAKLLSGISNIFVMDMNPDSENERENYKRLLGFTEKDFKLAKEHLKGLDRKLGQPFLLVINQIDGEKGRAVVPLYHCVGVNKLWAFSTRDQDHTFRSNLEARLKEAEISNPVRTSREVLSELFKTGSIKQAVDAEQKLNPSKTIKSIETELINRCLKKVLEEKAA